MVDDNVHFQKTIGYLFDVLGWAPPVIASTGREALAALSKSVESFDVIILDQKLPRLTGLQTLAQAREEHDRLPPVIMITGSNEAGLEAEARGLGVVEFVRKSKLDEPEDFRDLLAKALGRP